MSDANWGFCKDCLYYRDREEADEIGLCTRHAPRPIVMTKMSPKSYEPNAMWPIVSDEDGCGEFQTREEEAQE